MARRKLIAGNWKMNNTNEESVKLAKEILESAKNVTDKDIVVAPTFMSLSQVNSVIKNTNIKLAAQNMYYEASGAFTGQISADMLKDVGCEYVILGHSECRSIFGETDSLINKKIKRALEVSIKPIFCIGETLEEREKGITESIVQNQTKAGFDGISESDARNVIIAYEPVWAIGTGKTATPEDADSVHKVIRNTLKNIYNEAIAESMIILYGGSMNDANASELLNMPNIDGGLIGGAALKADKFLTIINSKIV